MPEPDSKTTALWGDIEWPEEEPVPPAAVPPAHAEPEKDQPSASTGDRETAGTDPHREQGLACAVAAARPETAGRESRDEQGEPVADSGIQTENKETLPSGAATATDTEVERGKEEPASLEVKSSGERPPPVRVESPERPQEELRAQAIALAAREATLAAGHEALESRRADVEARQKALEGERARFEEYRKAGEEARRLSEKLWPGWLRTGELAPWRERLEAGVYDPAAAPSAALLFAAVHTYNAALHDPDPKVLADALRDVGRRLYAWLHDTDATETTAATTAGQWAGAINAECAGRGDVEVPVPGNAANNRWMIFQPRGGSSPDVVGVRSWCVRDAQQRVIHRAEVTV